jgi:hypothetical protein
MKKGWMKKHGPWIPVVLAFIVFSLGVVLLLHDRSQSMKLVQQGIERWDMRGTMGDFYGGHLAAFSGIAAFLLMFAAFLLQKQELESQREENKESREIFSGQKRIQEKQVELMELAYEREYVFSFVNSLNEIIGQRALIMASNQTSTSFEDRLKQPYTGMLNHITGYIKDRENHDQYFDLLRSVIMPDLIIEDKDKYPNAAALKRSLEKAAR